MFSCPAPFQLKKYLESFNAGAATIKIFPKINLELLRLKPDQYKT